jgi:RHS repeat-associated protein
MNTLGNEVGRQRYYPFGAPRNQSGMLYTDYRFTGQRSEEANLGSLYDYGGRFYSPVFGRFVSADAIVPRPGDPQSLNRYSYARNNPLIRVDPSGHADCPADDRACWENEWYWKNRWYNAHGWYADDEGGWSRPGPIHFADADIAVEWLIERMLGDAASSTTALIRFLNEQASLYWVLSTMRAAAPGPKKQAYELWISMVKSGAPWDYKKEVLERFGPGVEVNGVVYRFDILGNIHYGFVGMAAGFGPLELKAGAGAANFWDNLKNEVYRGKLVSEGWLFRSFADDPSDQAAISVGVELYTRYQLSVTIQRFYEVFSRYAGLLAPGTQ